MSTVHLQAIGRFGNLLFQHAFARAFCEQNSHELRTDPWVGEHVFTLDGQAPKRPDGTEAIKLSGYFQAQHNMIYTRAQCRKWFALKTEIEGRLWYMYWPGAVAHYRRGDYASAGYPLISHESVQRAAIENEIIEPIREISDDTPNLDSDFVGDLSMMPDFYCLMRAPILFRANSSFSWWAATLGTGRVFSPVITGLAGGIEHDNVPYVEGNHPRLAELEFVTDLYLPE